MCPEQAPVCFSLHFAVFQTRSLDNGAADATEIMYPAFPADQRGQAGLDELAVLSFYLVYAGSVLIPVASSANPDQAG